MCTSGEGSWNRNDWLKAAAGIPGPQDFKRNPYLRTAAIAAAAYFTGGAAAGALGAGGATGAAGAGAADAGMTAAEAAQLEASLGGIDAMQAGGLGGMGGVETYAPVSEAAGLLNSAPVTDLSVKAGMGDTTKALLGKFAGGGAKGGGLLATQLGMQMMNPAKPPMPMAPPPQGGQLAPMPLPYGGQAGNSLGGQMPQLGQQQLTPEMLRKLHAMGMI